MLLIHLTRYFMFSYTHWLGSMTYAALGAGTKIFRVNIKYSLRLDRVLAWVEEACASTISEDRGLRDIIVNSFHEHPELANLKRVQTILKCTNSLTYDVFTHWHNQQAIVTTARCFLPHPKDAYLTIRWDTTMTIQLIVALPFAVDSFIKSCDVNPSPWRQFILLGSKQIERTNSTRMYLFSY